MIYHGIDMVEIERIAHAIRRHGTRFLARVFTSHEIAHCAGRAQSLAARWAAKEAAAKLLGVGLRGLASGPSGAQIGLTEIEVINDPLGRPTLALHGAAAERARQLQIVELAISLSHTRGLAIASVVGRADTV
jgi:holo-[acyl-carrier protein] synthase